MTSAPPPYPIPAPKTNVLSIVAFVSSFFVALCGVICGHIALSQIKRTGEQGRGFALAGLIIGYVSIVLTVFFVILWIAAIGVAASAGYLR